MDIVKIDGYESIYCVDCFQKEFEIATNNEEQYRKWLDRCLDNLAMLGKKVLTLKFFEMLETGETELCSIRYPGSKLNPRVIFLFVESDSIVLITAFKEKSGGDYKRAIRKARKRCKELLN